MVKVKGEKDNSEQTESTQEKQVEETEVKKVAETVAQTDQVTSEKQQAQKTSTEVVEESKTASETTQAEEQQQQSQKIVEQPKTQKQSSQEGDAKDGDQPQKKNSQIQQKFEQNLNTAISAMGGLMSGFINKVQQGTTNITQNQSTTLRRLRNDELIQEREVLMQSAQNRKSTVYSQLKDWDTARINSLNIHRNVIESILGRVDQRMKASQDNLTGLAIFIRAIVDQIKNSVAVNVPNISMTHAYKTLYNKIHETFVQFEDSIQDKKKKVQVFNEKVESEIHQGIFAAEAEHYSNTIATIRGNLLNLKRSLHEQQLKVSRKSMKVKDVYNHNTDTNKKAKKDFQKSLYSFLLACQDFRDLQVILAKATVGFWKKAVELEKHRSKQIHQIIAVFNKLHKELVIDQGLFSHYSEEMSKTLDSQAVTDEFIVSHMDFNAIISAEDQIYISTQLKKPKKITVPTSTGADGKEIPEQGSYDITIQEVYHFLTKINYPQFDDTGLSHKKLQVQRELSKAQFKNTTIVITPDSFLLCYDELTPPSQPKEEEEHKDQSQQQIDESKRNRSSSIQNVDDENYQRLFYQRRPDYVMKIQQISLKKQGLILDVKSSSKSTLISMLYPSQEIKFQFKNSDLMEELISTLQVLEEPSD